MATKKSGKSTKSTQGRKPYVNYSTIWNSVGGGYSNAGEGHIVKVGQYKVMVSRSERVDRYGNPVHTATFINKDGSLGATSKGNGSASHIVSETLKKEGIDTKYRKKPAPKKK